MAARRKPLAGCELRRRLAPEARGKKRAGLNLDGANSFQRGEAELRDMRSQAGAWERDLRGGCRSSLHAGACQAGWRTGVGIAVGVQEHIDLLADIEWLAVIGCFVDDLQDA